MAATLVEILPGLELSTDEWVGSHSKDCQLSNAEWHDIDTAVDRLDQKRFTQVQLRRQDGLSLVVGGGLGRYVVYVAGPDDEIHTLSVPGREGEEKLVTGGQLGVFPARIVVGIEEVRVALRAFVEEGRPATNLTWHLQGGLKLV